MLMLMLMLMNCFTELRLVPIEVTSSHLLDCASYLWNILRKVGVISWKSDISIKLFNHLNRIQAGRSIIATHCIKHPINLGHLQSVSLIFVKLKSNWNESGHLMGAPNICSPHGCFSCCASKPQAPKHFSLGWISPRSLKHCNLIWFNWISPQTLKQLYRIWFNLISPRSLKHWPSNCLPGLSPYVERAMNDD